jgi:prepilin-type N-terminal cleavage/methylation domain-containing protein
MIFSAKSIKLPKLKSFLYRAENFSDKICQFMCRNLSVLPKIINVYRGIISVKNNNQSGFSLIELVLVVTIVMVLATITFPFLFQARYSAENRNAFASLRTMASAQVAYFSQKGRFARLDELNTEQTEGLGTVVGTDIVRGKFTFQMSPVTPTDAQLREGYTIVATKASVGTDLPCILTLDESGFITAITSCGNPN